MEKSFAFNIVPTSRIASFDVYSVAKLKHHVAAFLEFDVTESRIKIKQLKRSGQNISFNAWLIKVIGMALELHPEVSSYLYNKKKLITFKDINISLIVEKEIEGKKVPMPLIIEQINKKSIAEIAQEIENAKTKVLSNNDIVLHKRSKKYENLYYLLPGFMRRVFWHFMLRNPKMAYKNMGNVGITSLGMIGKINGWFIHKSLHPVSFGTGSIIKKPIVINNEIKIREILNVTVLLDHDVVDGAPMVRFLNDLNNLIEKGYELA
ncbi:MAG: dehydrogenase [Bacteroidetes bacterium GWF2_33_16]|nr:MAG: dehydrogenase [Bacteroidetes bacterium GWE2_32_14]OFY06069.1 MAG: dehydrogenase [Bacteroidetes bacterium GWF2_33_16]